MSGEEPLEASAWIIHRWDCPSCESENEVPVGLSCGQTEVCDSCGVTVRITDVR